MSKIQQTKIPVNIENLAMLLTQNPPSWKLVREHDGLTKHSVDILWIEFDVHGFFKAKHNEPAVGRSLLMSPFNDFFTWQTTDIIKILELSNDFSYVKFKTKNSVYELTKII
jgi:hypothetical protein